MSPKTGVFVPQDLWDEIMEFIEQQVDVRDGSDGQQLPNTAMYLSSRIDHEVTEAQREQPCNMEGNHMSRHHLPPVAFDRCEVCAHSVDDCICPECPECGQVGDPNCYEDGDSPRILQRNEAQILGYCLFKRGVTWRA